MTFGPRVDIEGPPPRSGLIRGVIVAAVVIAVPVALVLALVYALPKLAGKPDPPPPPDEVQVASVRSKYAEASAKFAELEAAHKKLDAAFQDAFGVTLEMSADKNTLPRDFNDYMAAKDAPLEAWTKLRNACVTEAQFNDKRAVLRAVEGKTRDLTASLTDRHDMEDVLAWATTRLSAIRGQAENLDSIREKLQAYRTKENP